VPADLPIHPASTVLVLRDSPAGPEVFMVRRHDGTAFMAGAHVFPGGRVDAGDREAAQVDETWCDGIAHATAQLAGMSEVEAVAYHVAAARELFEEAGASSSRWPAPTITSASSGTAAKCTTAKPRCVTSCSVSV
jgi:8-oxo-dGTP pyrophosphatase MutT (NUDIX family)